jgi:hypothetical protein
LNSIRVGKSAMSATRVEFVGEVECLAPLCVMAGYSDSQNQRHP